VAQNAMDQPLGAFQALIVDDNRQMRFLLRSLLAAGGMHRVAEAEHAEEALRLMRKRTFDLLLVDWCMSPVNGIDFVREIRTSPDSPNPYVAIIMVSAHSEMFRVEAARDAGVNAFLVKPVSTRMLFERVQFALTDRRPFARSTDFFGPDRRFAEPDAAYAGPLRRAADRAGADEFCIDDAAA
jgi:CheY-like chemotaxis protein